MWSWWPFGRHKKKTEEQTEPRTEPQTAVNSELIYSREAEQEAEEEAAEAAEEKTGASRKPGDVSRTDESQKSGESSEADQSLKTKDEKAGSGLSDEAFADELEKRRKKKSLYDWVDAGAKKKGNRSKKVHKKPVVLSDKVTLGRGQTKICVPISGAGDGELIAEAEKARDAKPDLVEWRADFYQHIDDEAEAGAVLEKIRQILGDMPLLFTYRSSNEGGKGSTDGGVYTAAARWAAGRPEISVIDVEGLSNQYDPEILVKQLHEAGKKVIASAHFFDRTPKKEELAEIFSRLAYTGADVVKVAAMPKKGHDVLRLMNASEDADAEMSCPLIAISMGDLGKISRISGCLTGSCMTFATAGEATAPGQMPVEVLRSMMGQLEN